MQCLFAFIGGAGLAAGLLIAWALWYSYRQGFIRFFLNR